MIKDFYKTALALPFEIIGSKIGLTPESTDSSIVKFSASEMAEINKNFEHSVETITLEQMASYTGGISETWTGEKFLGGFGYTKDYNIVDFWTIRQRSKQLFTENLYAKGIIRRLITNEINKGLSLEATPDASILGMDADKIDEWSEKTERRFAIWGKNQNLCDYRGSQTFGALQRQARMMALISGDVLVILRQGPAKLPLVDLVDADSISNPSSSEQIKAVRRRGNQVSHGVELNIDGRHMAFFVKQKDGSHIRVSAYGEKTGRKQAWLLYGTEKMIDDVRGQSLLAIVIQSLKEVDRYRDAEQRAAVVNSMIAMWIEKSEDKISTLPMTGGAKRVDTLTTQNDAQGRKDIQFSANMPGMVFQELQEGEKPHSYDTRRPNINFAAFEAAIVNSIAWACEMPPEVLTLSFQNNYSASRGAVNEFKMYLERIRTGFGEEFCDPIYQDHLLSEILNGNIQANGFIEAWKDISKWDIYGAWSQADWAGAIKPNVDLLKEVRAYKELASEGWITRDRAAKELTGQKYSKIIAQLKRENRELAVALGPLIDAGIIKDENPETEPIEEEEEK